MRRITLIIPGSPIAKKRPKFYRRGDNVGTYNPSETEEGKWIKMVVDQLKDWELLELLRGPVSLELYFHMPITKSWPKYKIKALEEGKIFHHIKKPDLDNLIKFAKDCLNKIVWNDDSQVFKEFAIKQYSLKPETLISIEEHQEV